MIYHTSDGYELEFKDGKWTDGDLVFESGTTGIRSEPIPVDDKGEPLPGKMFIKDCECGGEMFFTNGCGVFVCEDCDNHDGLARCFCGWAASGGNGYDELLEMGETIEPEDY